LGDEIREHEMASASVTGGGKREIHTGLKERDHLSKRHRWKDNSKMDLQEIRLENVDWIYLASMTSGWQL
jgi:hypothetical protein